MNRRIEERLLFGAAALLLTFLAGCHTGDVSEAQRFEASVRKELPFRVDSLRWFDGIDVATYQFASHDYVPTPPDAEIDMKGEWNTLRLHVEGSHIQTWLNGVPMSDLEDELIGNCSGRLMLQIHDGNDIKVL